MSGVAILTADELDRSGASTGAPRSCPPAATTIEAVLDWERERIVRTDWVMAARVEDVPTPGSFKLLDLDGEQLLLVRGKDDVIRAFYNVCRHRGTAVEERECGTAVRFQCPYHAWIYDLDGRLVAGQAHRGPRGLQLRRRSGCGRSSSPPGRASCSST